MLIHVKDIPSSGKEISAQFVEKDLDWSSSDTEIEILRPIIFQGKAFKSGEDILINGHIQAELKVSCHRCLEPFEMEVESDLDLFFQPLPSEEKKEDLEDVNPEELGILHYRDNKIDLSEEVRDTIVLEIPMKLLCQESCQGLCLKCGVNRNSESCSCLQEKSKSNPFKEFFQKQE